MMPFKKKVTRFLLALEIVIFIANFLCSKNGLHAITTLQNENKSLCQEISAMQKTVQGLKNEITQWNAYPFYKEKAARELHMSRPNETIYYMY